MSAFEVIKPASDIPVTIIKINERVNLSNTNELEAIARQEFENGMRNLILDLSATPSITSAGLRSIVVIYRLLSQAAPTGPTLSDTLNRPKKSPYFKLLCPTPEVRRILEIAAMDTRFEIYDELQPAIDSFAQATTPPQTPAP
jgi:anti-anti-sigma regulatory factor